RSAGGSPRIHDRRQGAVPSVHALDRAPHAHRGVPGRRAARVARDRGPDDGRVSVPVTRARAEGAGTRLGASFGGHEESFAHWLLPSRGAAVLAAGGGDLAAMEENTGAGGSSRHRSATVVSLCGHVSPARPHKPRNSWRVEDTRELGWFDAKD